MKAQQIQFDEMHESEVLAALWGIAQLSQNGTALSAAPDLIAAPILARLLSGYDLVSGHIQSRGFHSPGRGSQLIHNYKIGLYP
jgi:hypothetical protein